MKAIRTYRLKYYSNDAVQIIRQGSTTEIFRFPYDQIYPALESESEFIDNPFIVYILVGRNTLGKDKVYVGKSKNGVNGRPQSHEDKLHATFCYILTQDQDNTFFNDGVIQYLEDQINKMIGACSYFHNTTEVTTPETINEDDRVNCEQYLDEAVEMLRAIGLDIKKIENSKEEDTIPGGFPGGKKPPVSPVSPVSPKMPPLPQIDMPAGQFVRTAFDNLLKSGYVFTDEQLQQYGSIDATTQYTKQNKPLFWVLKEGQTRNSLPKNVRNRYWSKVYMAQGQSFLLFSQWFPDKHLTGARKQNFIEWYKSLPADHYPHSEATG